MGLEDELLALKLKKRSCAIQTKIYRQLARLQNHHQIDREITQGSKVCRGDTLELSLAPIFEEFVSFRSLEWIEFGGLNHRIG